jgi:Icc protein
MANSQFYFLQLSDAHVYGDFDREGHAVKPALHLRTAVGYINSLEPAPAFCVYTGDSVAEDTDSAYLLFKKELEALKTQIYFAIGNHDDRKMFRKHVLADPAPSDAPYYYDFQKEGWHFVVLDTSDPGKITGIIDREQLHWLGQVLNDPLRRPTVVFLHHPPLKLGIPWLDELMLQDPTPLLDILQGAPWIRWVFFGHVHHECHIRFQGLHFTSVPALSYQFGETRWAEKFVRLPPGFRFVHIDGEHIRTAVHRLAECKDSGGPLSDLRR